ncbi:hypothetical protein Tco_0418483 [Tanacetum coccineum]
MSSPNHPTSDIEDAFSSNFSDYIPASPDYVSASPRNTYSSSSNNSFESPIPLPTIVPPSSMLSPMFNSQEFFQPEELLSEVYMGTRRSIQEEISTPLRQKTAQSSWLCDRDLEDKAHLTGGDYNTSYFRSLYDIMYFIIYF